MKRGLWIGMASSWLLVVPAFVTRGVTDEEVAELRARVVELEKELALTQSTLEEREEDIAELEAAQSSLGTKAQATETELTGAKATGAAVALIVSLLGVGIYTHLKKWSEDTLLKKAKEDLGKDLADRFETQVTGFKAQIDDGFRQLGTRASSAESRQKEKLAELGSQHERFLSDLITLLSRAKEEQHDEAIEEIGWRGDPAALEAYPESIRKLVIRSALLGERSRERYGEVAWKAAEKILADSKTEADLSFLLETADAAKRWSKGYAYFEQYRREVRIRSNPEGFLALLSILRLSLDFDALLQAEAVYEGPRTPRIVHYLGHVRNNLADFEGADQLLEPQVQEIVLGGLGRLPSKWEQVVYSFLLNCMAWGKPGRGLGAARLAVQARGDTLLQLGVLRLALQLEAAGGAEARELIEGVRENLRYMPRDSSSLQAQARLIAHDGRQADGALEAARFLRAQEEWVLTKKAIELLREDRDRAFSDKYDLVLPRAEYFYICLIGEMLIKAGELEEAREVLYKLSLNDPVGEALFWIAVAYAGEQDADREAVEHLERAGMIHRRWCRIATLYPELTAAHERLGLEPCYHVPDPLATAAERSSP